MVRRNDRIEHQSRRLTGGLFRRAFPVP
jgi:hypothetical protein